jgi:tetratricopeptide (TPR) repeat protein
MPTTVNGVGTHYYGKRNLSVRVGNCAACHHHGKLESYDTRLWFVILFIPIIPLGRKRIMDNCPSCSRHYAADADSYEQAKQLQTSGSLEQYQREPSPETALMVHAQMLSFREHEQAAEFRSAALARFPKHVRLRVGMAQHLRDMSAYNEANQLFKEALELDGDDPDARAGVALVKMTENDLDGARTLLAHLEEPGAAQQYDLGPLDILAGYYQRAGRHEEALALAEVLLREWPTAGNLHAFRAFVQKSEKAVGRSESMLPQRRFSLTGLLRSEGSPYAPWQRWLAIGAVLFALVAGGLALNNEYIRRHRTIHVLNVTGAPAHVQVDDQAPVSIQGLGTITVAEGPHTIKVSGPVTETHEVSLDSDYFARWFRNPAWILNVGKEGVLAEVRHVYAAAPPPSQETLIVGESFIARPTIDYIFEAPPDKMSLSSKNSQVVKTQLTWLQGQDAGVVHDLAATNRAAALDFAERRLKRQPERQLLGAYMRYAGKEDLPRVEALMKTRLDVRPVDVNWHRMYQHIAERLMPEEQLAAYYDKLLAAEPSSAPLLYLRGRIEPDLDKQESFMRRSIEADKALAWPWIGLAWRACGQGQWDECIAAGKEANERHPEETDSLNEVVHVARLGKGEAAALVDEYRTRLSANPMHGPTLQYLLDALAAAGKAGDIDEAVTAWENGIPEQFRSLVVPRLKVLALYLKGNAQECEALCQGQPDMQGARAHALFAMSQAKKAAEDPDLKSTWDDPWNALALSLALQLDGAAEEATAWRGKALEAMRREHGDLKRAAQALSADKPPTVASLSNISVRPHEKPLLLAALAGTFPAQASEYRALAAKLNVRRTPPYLLVQRALEDGKAGPQP